MLGAYEIMMKAFGTEEAGAVLNLESGEERL